VSAGQTSIDSAASDSARKPTLPRRATRRWPRATTTRIALIVFIGLVVSSAIILGFIARVTQGQLDADAQALIIAERDTILEAFDEGGPAGAAAVIDTELRIHGPLAMLLTGPRGTSPGRPIAGNLDRWPLSMPRDNRFHRLDLTRHGRRSAEPFAATASALPGGYRLLVGRSLEEEQRLTATLETSLVTAIGLALLLATGISWLLARIIAARVQDIADVAAAVAGGDLHRRVDLPESGNADAFDKLGTALNAMLARIELLLDELRSVTDGLAHDLRSPLTRMKARIDRLARSFGESDEGIANGAAMVAIGQEADLLLAMLANSLEISRMEAGIGRDGFRATNLAALVTDLAEMYEPLADDSGVKLTTIAPPTVPVLAHRELLSRALSNLIDNALRYGASGGSIEVEAVPTAAGVRLSVADRGPGIDTGSHDEALRRFGRLDAARSAGGAGLGLSLAAAVARLHGGALTLHANHPGLKVSIDLPGRET
jgi:signal transduction histidine kinase